MVELSSLDVLFLARELATLEDAYVDRVYEVAPGEFLVRTRHPARGRANLLFKPGAYACLADEAPETPESPTSFAVVLRKYLPGMRIRRVDQHEFDRVLAFSLEQRGEPHRLILELFGKGNLVLVGPDDKILLAQRTETFRDRTVRRGEAFQFPPQRVNPVTIEAPEFERRLEASEKDAVRTLALDLAMGGELAEELCHRAGVPKDRKARALDAVGRAALWTAWRSLVHGPPQPQFAESAALVRVESVPFTAPRFADAVRTPQPSLSKAIDEARRRQAASPVEARDEEKERLLRQIEHQEAAIAEFGTEAAAWEARGRFLYEHYEEAQAALAASRDLVDRHGWSELPGVLKRPGAAPPLLRALPEARKVVVRVAAAELELVPEDSLERNASRYFDEAKRIRAKAQSAALALEEARKRLLERPAPAPRPAARPRATGKQFWFESYRWCYTSEGLLVVGGRDAGSNERLVKKHLNPSDLYFHADVHGAPSCLLKTEGRPPGEASLREAAQFAVSYSRAFNQFATADAYWVKPEQVSKTAPTGEYVAKGAFVIRGTRNYVPQLPMEVAIGPAHLSKDGRPQADGALVRVMAGPPDAVRHWCPRHARVARGKEKAEAVAKRLAPLLGATIDEIVARLPPGTLQVLEAPGAPA